MLHLFNLLNERTSKYGDRTLFKYKNKSTNQYESLSWNNILDQTKQVSKSLIHLGFKFNDKIGIISSNKPEWTISDFGILGIRGVVVPFYATASKHDVKYIIDETEMRLLFVGNNDQIEKALWLLENCKTLDNIIVYEGDIPENNDHFMEWNQFLNLSENDSLNEKLENIQAEYKEDDLATIIYTSGTTGEPKGVMLGHDNFMQALKINYERLQVGDHEVSFCFLPLSHVFERTWTYFLIYCGATNVFLENTKEVINELPKVKPTLMCAVPRFFEKTYEGIQLEAKKWPSFKRSIFNWSVKIGHQYIEYLKDSKKAPARLKFKHKIADKLVLKNLRAIFGGKINFMPCAGAAIDSSLLRFFHAAGIFINYGYGATETTATVSCFRSDIYNFDYCGSIMPETEIMFGDEKEIMVKGKTIFKGYYNKPEETSKVLKEGWYLTGDEGYVVDNEYLVMTDRLKDLIKTSGGKYVSPQKIELLVSQDKFIEQLVVIGDNRKFITALIVPSFSALREFTKKLNLNSEDKKAIAEHPAVIQFIQGRLDQCQAELTPYEKIIKFTLLFESFNIDNKTLTNTLKVRRKFVEEHYKETINKMYLSA